MSIWSVTQGPMIFTMQKTDGLAEFNKNNKILQNYRINLPMPKLNKWEKKSSTILLILFILILKFKTIKMVEFGEK